MLLTNFPEWCQLLPASDQRARATHPVTLAGHLHAVDHGLELELDL